MLKIQAIVEKIWLSTYPVPQAVSHPIFAESRVHQRSSGNPYPNQVVCDVNIDTPAMKEYTVVRLENGYLRLLLLPEIGGRIFEAYDKVNDYYFFYRQHVIKPALIGLLGSWISGAWSSTGLVIIGLLRSCRRTIPLSMMNVALQPSG